MDGSGYILEAGNILTIERIALDSVNKFAINVIQHQITDHYDPEEDEEQNFENIKGKFLSEMEKNSKAKTELRKTSNLYINEPEISSVKAETEKPPVRSLISKRKTQTRLKQEDTIADEQSDGKKRRRAESKLSNLSMASDINHTGKVFSAKKKAAAAES